MASLMNFSEGTNLAVHAMAYLHELGPQRSASSPEITKAVGGSKDHLGKVLQRLARVNLLTSRRGPRGGFTLEKSAEEIMLLDIVEAIEGPLTTKECPLGRRLCEQKKCVLRDFLTSLHKQVFEFLSTTSLAAVPKTGGIMESTKPAAAPGI